MIKLPRWAWFAIGVIVAYEALRNPGGAGHLVTEVINGISTLLAKI